MDNFNLEIKNFAQINRVQISIKKINVVCGVNSCGKSIISKLLYCFLKNKITDESLDYLLDSEGLFDLKESEIAFKGDLNPSEIFYIDNMSIMDLKDLDFLRVDHIIHIKEALEDDNRVKSSDILSKIENIIGCDRVDPELDSSGVKEIGIIQTLIKNNKLKENSFLIIDEPEASLHPEWEIKFAEILIILVKELNIHIYLNSHSPMFIEAISLYSQYYDLLSETNFYLTQKQDNGKYDFRKINPKNMGEVYENLTSPYDELDKLKAKILFKE